MALRISKTFDKYGFSSSVCYVKIDRYGGDKHFITARLGYYYDETARWSGKAPLDSKSIRAPFSDGMTITDIYTYIKATDAEFAGAEDVLDEEP